MTTERDLKIAEAVRGVAESMVHRSASRDHCADRISMIDLAAIIASIEPEPVAVTDELPDAVFGATVKAIGDAYDCLRVWSAWGVGTMGPDDFALVSEDGDRVAEIARAAITAWIATTQQSEGVAVCQTCNGHGMIGGPSFHNPDEGGEPCPDCAAKQPAQSVPDGWRDQIERAISRAAVFDDGSDGADAESARSVVGILRALLATK